MFYLGERVWKHAVFIPIQEHIFGIYQMWMGKGKHSKVWMSQLSLADAESVPKKKFLRKFY